MSPASISNCKAFSEDVDSSEVIVFLLNVDSMSSIPPISLLLLILNFA